MDACIAFRFVFDAGRTRKFLGSKTLAMETQVSKIFAFIILKKRILRRAFYFFSFFCKSIGCFLSIFCLDLKTFPSYVGLSWHIKI